MKTQLPAKIETVDDVKKFIADIIKNEEFYHFDDDATQIINCLTSQPTFTQQDAEKLNELFAQCFALVDVWELVTVSGIGGIRLLQDDDSENLLSFLAPEMWELLQQADSGCDIHLAVEELRLKMSLLTPTK